MTTDETRTFTLVFLLLYWQVDIIERSSRARHAVSVVEMLCYYCGDGKWRNAISELKCIGCDATHFGRWISVHCFPPTRLPSFLMRMWNMVRSAYPSNANVVRCNNKESVMRFVENRSIRLNSTQLDVPCSRLVHGSKYIDIEIYIFNRRHENGLWQFERFTLIGFSRRLKRRLLIFGWR